MTSNSDFAMYKASKDALTRLETKIINFEFPCYESRCYPNDVIDRIQSDLDTETGVPLLDAILDDYDMKLLISCLKELHAWLLNVNRAITTVARFQDDLRELQPTIKPSDHAFLTYKLCERSQCVLDSPPPLPLSYKNDVTLEELQNWICDNVRIILGAMGRATLVSVAPPGNNTAVSFFSLVD